jgi:hypothetical protein
MYIYIYTTHIRTHAHIHTHTHTHTGTENFAVRIAANPARMLLHRASSPPRSGWSHHTSFWAYTRKPSPQLEPITTKITVEDARNPDRALVKFNEARKDSPGSWKDTPGLNMEQGRLSSKLGSNQGGAASEMGHGLNLGQARGFLNLSPTSRFPWTKRVDLWVLPA